MKWLPSENLRYQTSLSHEEITQRLDKCIHSTGPNLLGYTPSDAEFTGRRTSNSFEIRYINAYSTLFNPIISGSISADAAGVAIEIHMQLDSFLEIFLTLVMSFAGLAGLFCLFLSFANAQFNPFVLVPFGIIIVVYGLSRGLFSISSSFPKRRLKEIFEAKVTDR